MSKDKKENIEAIYPLSPMQEGMLFHSLSGTDSTAYFEQYTCTIKGNLSTENFIRAWQRVVDHNPILRTLVLWEREDKPLQVVRKQATLDWHIEDWRDVTEDQCTSKLQQLLLAYQEEGFNLKKAPLMSMALLRMADDEYFYIWNFHHLLLDGWSGPLLFNQVFSLYKAFSQGKDIELKQTPPYRNYITWLQKQDMSRVEQYWRKQLAGFENPTSIDLPVSISGLLDEPAYKKTSLKLSAEATSALELIARQNQVTLNTVVQGAWALLLSKYSRENDVVFGSTVSGRPAELPGVEEIVGIFINTLPVRVKMDFDAKVLDWLKDIQLNQLGSKEFEYSSLADIQRWSDIPAGQALFESILIYENYPVVDEDNTATGFTIENEQTREETNYPITIGVEVSDTMLLNCIYDLSRYDLESINRLLSHFRNILENIASKPEQKLKQVSLLNDEESQLLASFNPTDVDYPDECIHQLVTKQAEKTPDKIAIAFQGNEVTFKELESKSNMLAQYILQQGVQQGDLVGLCVERSPQMITAMLAILKTGAGYLPLDPEYPRERIEFILDDSDVSLLVTEVELEELYSNISSKRVYLDKDWPEIESMPDSTLTTTVTHNDIAYVIYTSGSTGKPKGVLVPHRTVVNFLTSMEEKPGIEETDVLLAVTTLSFDIAVLELFLPLITGARVELADRVTASDGDALFERIKSSGVTMMQATPATWRLMLAAGWEKTDSFKVLCGGEAMPADLVSSLVKNADSVWNMYGPTETTVWSTTYEITDSTKQVLIGKPINNTQVYILDEFMQCQPVGIMGEMFIGGAGVAHGYLNRDDLTAERFVTGVLDDNPSARLYRTGDLVRYHADGNIEYINRLDNQVKVRGFRIELGEIEAVLLDNTDIDQVVTAVREDIPGDTRLVAYYVTDGSGDVSITSLRKHLRTKLPDYMIPQNFVELDKLPVTPNGKIDRLALPTPFNSGAVDNEYVEPRTENETVLAEIWQDILGIDKVGIHDNFFEVGGHSLLSVQVIVRFKNKTGIKLELRSLVMDTLEQIAAHCSTESNDENSGTSGSFMDKMKKGLKSTFSASK